MHTLYGILDRKLYHYITCSTFPRMGSVSPTATMTSSIPVTPTRLPGEDVFRLFVKLSHS